MLDLDNDGDTELLHRVTIQETTRVASPHKIRALSRAPNAAAFGTAPLASSYQDKHPSPQKLINEIENQASLLSGYPFKSPQKASSPAPAERCFDQRQTQPWDVPQVHTMDALQSKLAASQRSEAEYQQVQNVAIAGSWNLQWC